MSIILRGENKFTFFGREELKKNSKTRASTVQDEFPDTNDIIKRSRNQFQTIPIKQDRSNTLSMNFQSCDQLEVVRIPQFYGFVIAS